MKKFTKAIRMAHPFRIALLVCVFLPNFVYSQNDEIRVDTNLIRVPVTVFNRDGYRTDLKKEDFEIYEDGIRQEIDIFESFERPLTAFLLLDQSGSMWKHLPRLAATSSAFAVQLRPDDTIIAAGFGERIQMLIKPTKVVDLRPGITLSPMSNKYHGTVVFDAVALAQKKLSKIKGRKAIILFSDGVGERLLATAKSTLKDAEEQEALIYAIRFPLSLPITRHGDEELMRKQYPKWEAAAREYMSELSARTGGRYFDIREMEDLEGVFREIALELRQQYNLGYYTKNSKGGSRQIRVKVNRPDVAVRARSSFVLANSEECYQVDRSAGLLLLGKFSYFRNTI